MCDNCEQKIQKTFEEIDTLAKSLAKTMSERTDDPEKIGSMANSLAGELEAKIIHHVALIQIDILSSQLTGSSEPTTPDDTIH